MTAVTNSSPGTCAEQGRSKGDKRGSRGLRNNNPLNIRHSKDKWQGKALKQTDMSFVQFKSRVYGYRAAFKILHTYITKGKDTIGKIIAKWAPSSDGNNTQSYINYVSRTTGINASHALRWEDKDDLVEVVRSMAHMESGIIEDKALVEEAYDLANKQ